MTGWNLPPGCNVGDLPGNGSSPAEERWEAIYDLLARRLADKVSETVLEQLTSEISEMVAEAFDQGYLHGLAFSDEEEDRAL